MCRVSAILAVGALGVACGGPPPLPPYDAEAHRANVEEWRAWRHGELVKPDGWLSLSGLYWLTEGEHRLGAAAENELTYARDGVADLLGTFRVTGDQVRFRAAPNVPVELVSQAPDEGGSDLVTPVAADADALVYDMAWREDDSKQAPAMQLGAIQWYVIVREDHLALRLKDAASPRVVDFTAMPNFELNPDMRFNARFEFYDPPKSFKIPNVFGSINDEESLGAVVFTHEGVEYRLDMWRDSADPDNFFTAFGDATNAVTSYGAGRFLWVDAPDEWGRTVVDFNRSYNPPCALSPFATCPLPPAQNRLSVAIEAGEMSPTTEVDLPAGPPAGLDSE